MNEPKLPIATNFCYFRCQLVEALVIPMHTVLLSGPMRPVPRAQGAPLSLGGALDCFCARTPQTLATPLSVTQLNSTVGQLSSIVMSTPACATHQPMAALIRHHRHHHRRRHHIFVYHRSCHAQLSYTYYDNSALLWQHTDINLTVTFIENTLSVSYLNVIKTNVNRYLYTTSAQYSLGY